METYIGADHWATETYMIPGTGSNPSNPNLTSTAPLQEADVMGNEVVPEFIVDQGLYYPAANYYGYFCTGYESPSPGEWDDHHRFFGLDGQELHSSGLQTEGLQYVYYTPSYGYAQSPYNPYNPYIPGAVIGSDSSFIGTQQYIASPAYQQSVSSPAFIPVVLQPGIDVIPTVTPDPTLLNASGPGSSHSENSVVKYTTPAAQVVGAASGSRESSQMAAFHGHSLSKSAEGSQAHATSAKNAALQGTSASASVQRISPVQNGYGPLQQSDHFPQGNGSSFRAPLKLTVPTPYGFTEFGSNVHGWGTVEKPRSRFQFGGVLSNGHGNPDILGEQNRGPRTSKLKDEAASTIVVKAYTTKAGDIDADGNIVINTNQYNRDDFLVNYPNAKFFVIKSYSEDDVHKSIKYNVWSSTPNGNKRLDAAYEDAKRLSGGDQRNCPIFLFFSVNASGQFCGVAEMLGPVDFHKDMEFWQQDKWSGSFPVKWHIVKDVPNTSFRHIILENNENKPVTNSRDTQEILYIPGLNMLSIFKDSPMRTSILDDFSYYEERQSIMYEEKSRLLGKNYGSLVHLTASAPPSKPSVTIRAPPSPDEKSHAPHDTGRSDKDSPNGDIVASKHEDTSASNVSPKVEDKSAPFVSSKLEDGSELNGKKDADSVPVEDASTITALLKIGSLSIQAKDGDPDNPISETAKSSSIGVFTVGSMPVKVNGFGESSSKILTIGTIPIDPKECIKQKNPSVVAPIE